MYKNYYTQVEPFGGSWVLAKLWEVCVPNTVTRTMHPLKKIELLMCCTLNLSGSGTLKEGKPHTYYYVCVAL
jgi:hypothetical protein